MLCAKFGWNWTNRFFNIVDTFLVCHNYLPLERDKVLQLKKLEFIHPRMCCVKFGWNWASGSGEYLLLMYFCYFLHDPSFEQTWIPYSQGCFVSSLIEIGPVFLEKKLKVSKVYREMDGTMDWQTNKLSEKLTLAFRSDELKRIAKSHLFPEWLGGHWDIFEFKLKRWI